jgi:hypothetical protein
MSTSSLKLLLLMDLSHCMLAPPARSTCRSEAHNTRRLLVLLVGVLQLAHVVLWPVLWVAEAELLPLLLLLLLRAPGILVMLVSEVLRCWCGRVVNGLQDLLLP